MYLRFQLIRGVLDETALDRELNRVRTVLRESDAPHLREFLNAWDAGSR